MIKRNIFKSLMIIFMLFFIFIFSCIINTSETYAATLKTIPSTDLKVSSDNILRFSAVNYTAEWNGVAGKVLPGKYSSYKALCVPIKTKTASFTYTNFLDITFTNVGQINGRQMDAKVHFNSMTVGARGGSATGERTDNYMSVCYLTDWTMWMAGNMEDGAGYRAAKSIDVTVTIYWHDSGETVDLPFFQCLQDIDAGASYYKEGWEAKSGFTGTYYKYSSCVLNFSGNKASSPSDLGLSGNDSLIKGGFYAPTTGGSFRSVFYEGNCATQLIPYSAYAIMDNPVKNSDGKDINEEEDLINYTVEQKMGKFYVDTMTTYTSFEISDVLPEGILFESAKVFEDDKDITAKGKLEYDEVTREVKFTMGSDWLNDISNYNGQNLTLKITTKVEPVKQPKILIKNTAETKLDGISLTSNTVNDVLAIPYRAEYKYVSETAGRNLPKEISTTSGEYKIEDNAVYYQGDTVKRKEVPADGTVYEKYDSEGNLEYKWVLTWDKESDEIDGGNVVFTGSWRYVPVPRLVIVKRLPEDTDFTQAHGEPTFLFKITGSDSGKSWYKSITFSEEAMKEVQENGTFKGPEGTQFVLQDGKIYGTCASIYLPEDDYTVEEIGTLRYSNKSVTARYHGNETEIIDQSENRIIVPLKLSSYKPGEKGFDAVYSTVCFDNEKIDWSRFSHSDIVINKLKGVY